MIRSALALVLLAGAALAQSAPQHVVVVVLDDVGTNKVACYGDAEAWKTPVLDGMAAAGARFTHVYANPTCSPSRAAMLTGRYGSRTGVDTGLPTYHPDTEPEGDFVPAATEPWLPVRLSGAGVRSYLVGKWHLNHILEPIYHQDPILKAGFVRWRGHLSNFTADQGEGYYHWDKQIADAAGWAEVPTTTYATADNFLEAWLALQAAAGRRSLTWVALNAPHAPWDEAPPAGLWTPQSGQQTDAKRYEYMLEAADTLLGQLRSFYAAALPADAAATTWLVIGDNGTPAAANQAEPSFQHKDTVYRGGVQVPLIVTGAGVADPGRTCDHVVGAVDIWATVLDLLGAPARGRPRTDSASFAPVLHDAQARPARTAAYVRHASPNGFGPKDWLEHGAYDGHWSLLRRQGTTPAVQLFDLDADPDQLTNLWPPDPGPEQQAVDTLQAVIDASSTP